MPPQENERNPQAPNQAVYQRARRARRASRRSARPQGSAQPRERIADGLAEFFGRHPVHHAARHSVRRLCAQHQSDPGSRALRPFPSAPDPWSSRSRRSSLRIRVAQPDRSAETRTARELGIAGRHHSGREDDAWCACCARWRTQLDLPRPSIPMLLELAQPLTWSRGGSARRQAGAPPGPRRRGSDRPRRCEPRSPPGTGLRPLPDRGHEAADQADRVRGIARLHTDALLAPRPVISEDFGHNPRGKWQTQHARRARLHCHTRSRLARHPGEDGTPTRPQPLAGRPEPQSRAPRLPP